MRAASNWTLLAVLTLAGCSSAPSSIPISNTPMTDVRLMLDTNTKTGHKHPYTMSTDAMVKVLSGIQVEERDTITGLGILGSNEGKPAFTQTEIARVSPYLVEALRKASPNDLATFYMVVSDGHQGRAVTSGGLFVDGKQLHLILANWRSVPRGGQDYTMAMELDTRDAPLLPISPFRFRVGFHPAEAWVKSSGLLDHPKFPAYRLAYGDPAKSIVIDLDALLNNASPTLVAP